MSEKERIIRFMKEQGGMLEDDAYRKGDLKYISPHKAFAFLHKDSEYARGMLELDYEGLDIIENIPIFSSVGEDGVIWITLNDALFSAKHIKEAIQFFGADARARVPIQDAPLIIDAAESRFIFALAPDANEWTPAKKKVINTG
jgi:hypothetical protein